MKETKVKLIYDSRIYLIDYPKIDEDEVHRFLNDEGVENWKSDSTVDADVIPEIAGRLCFMSFSKPRPGGNKAYLDRIKGEGHGSVIEHPVWGFIFTGVSRSLTHELVRHRHLSFSQLSQRYVDESEASFVVPPELHNEVRMAQEFMNKEEGVDQWGDGKLDRWEDVTARLPGTHIGIRWLRDVAYAQEGYTKQVEYLFHRLERSMFPPGATYSTEQRTTFRKAARGTARSLLPNCTETKIFVSANARAWRHFLEMRCSGPAEVEIRRLAYKVWERLVTEAPNTFSDYVAERLPDGTHCLKTDTRKV